MKRLARTSIAALAVTGGLLGASTPALADSYSLYMAAPTTAVVGQPVVVYAAGVNPPPSEYWAGSWIEAATISTSVMPVCPADDQSGIGVATSTGGQLLEIAMRPNLDADGNFLNLIGWTPNQPGQWLVCGYQDDGAGLTLARASVTVDVQPASAPAPAAPPAPPSTPTAPAAAPANVKLPRVTRSATKLVCNPGGWSNSAGGYSYGWLLNGKQKKGASGRKLRVTHAMRGRKAQCSVTASGPGGKATALSPPLRIR
jgi:hypothetical protein